MDVTFVNARIIMYFWIYTLYMCTMAMHVQTYLLGQFLDKQTFKYITCLMLPARNSY